MTLIATARDRLYAARIDENARAHAEPRTDGDRHRHQLDALNREWPRVRRTVPYYRELHDRVRLPDAFASLEEFVQRLPATTRDDVRNDRARMTSDETAQDYLRVTGGSTSSPVQLPAWRSEDRLLRYDMWLGRRWYGIAPCAPVFLLWGHSHLLGSGWMAELRSAKRALSDRALGYTRFSAYDMRPEKLRDAAATLLRSRPACVIGYSVALDQLARANLDRREALRALGLKTIVATAEAFPTEGSRALLEDLFGCPVAMEYGTVETGVLAHTHPSGGYRAFWRHHLIEAEPSQGGRHVLRVTSLYPRCFPLVRYEVGDEIELDDPHAGHVVGLAAFRRVAGRCNDYLRLPDGARIHSEVFSHTLRSFSEIRGFQVVHDTDGLRLRVTSDRALRLDLQQAIRRTLARVDPQLADVSVERVDTLAQTVAGKSRMIHSAIEQ